MKENIKWKDAPMPDSSPGTKLSTLFVNDTIERSRLMLVEFPKGFSRETTGHYPAYEEMTTFSSHQTLRDQIRHVLKVVLQ